MNDDKPTSDASATTRSGNGPIFDVDMPCPRCEYNLRGQIEPRCPECGQAFDPVALLELLKRPQGPSLLWALPRVLAHPVTFWNDPQVIGRAGPRLTSLCLLMVGVTALLAMTSGIPRAVARYAVWRWGWIPAKCFNGWGSSAGACVVHRVICQMVLGRCRTQDASGAASAVVYYPAVWLLVAGPAFMGCLFWMNHRILAVGQGAWVPWSGIASLLVVAGASLCWGRALYCAGRSASGGSRSCGIWCAGANPFWYIGCYIAWSEWVYPQLCGMF